MAPPPPPSTFYFPVGMSVSEAATSSTSSTPTSTCSGTAGRFQSYDLHGIRRDAAISAAGYSLSPQLPFPDAGGCLCSSMVALPPMRRRAVSGRPRLVFSRTAGLISPCAPSKLRTYERDSVTIGAFATDLQLSPWGNRLYSPVRGDASLTWLTVVPDLDGPPRADQQACDADAVRPDAMRRSRFNVARRRRRALRRDTPRRREPLRARQHAQPDDAWRAVRHAQSADGTPSF